MKRMTAVIVALVLLISVIPVAFAAATPFGDVVYGAWYYDAVNWAVGKGITTGTGSGMFSPDAVCTRAQVVTFLWRAEGSPDPMNWNNPFYDVGTNDYFYTAVLWAVEQGITNGLSTNTFGSNESCTRAQVATFLWRTEGKPSPSSGYTPFVDVIGGAYYYDAVLWAVESGVTNGLSASAFGPDAACSRGQIVTFLYRASGTNSENNGAELTAEQIYAKCSPAVFYIEVYDAGGNLLSSGSGFFIDSHGTAITNFHVIDDAYTAKILTADTGEVYNVLGVYDYSVEQDWAVIKVDGSGFTYLNIGNSSTITGGATIYTIGSPLGLDNTISQGLISNPSREISGIDYIQISAAISHGSSGGALINKYGDVIGITSAGFDDGQNLNLAIPISVISGYTHDMLTSLPEVANSVGTTMRSAAYNSLRNWIIDNYNLIESNGAYTYQEEEQDGSEEWIYKLTWTPETDWIGVSTIGASETSFAISLSSIDEIDEAVISVYTYYQDGWGEFTGWALIDPAYFDENYVIDYYKYEGNTSTIEEDKDFHKYLISISLDFINYIFNKYSSGYTVADLGFTSF